MRITRRRLLQMGAGSLLAAGVWPGVLDAQDPPAGDFQFLVLNDLHYLDQRSGTWLEQRVFAQMRRCRQRPRFIVIAGDLAEHGTREQLGPVKDLFHSWR